MLNNVSPSYSDPLVSRYTPKEMVAIFSDQNRYSLWRKLWLSLATHEKELGLPIAKEQIKQIEENLYNIDFTDVATLEAELQHDVMAHLHSLAKQAPLAKPILHLGATSEFIKDNTDLILIRDSLLLIKKYLHNLIEELSEFALKYKDLAAISFTHYQVAQPTTVGRRACLWLQSFLMDYKELLFVLENLKFRSIKGTTGTLASFKELFNNDYQKVQQLEEKIAKSFGFNHHFTISGQTYDRKVDVSVLNLLAQIATSSHKMTNDIRLLQNLKEIEESFGKNQIGSSAMPYKRNPIKSERVSSLAKYLMSLPQSALMVASTQWLERTLDDSANRRITLPQGFFTASSILKLLIDITKNLSVNEKVIHKNLMAEIPFLATENIMMEAVKLGGDRQEIHEKIRQYAIATKRNMVENGGENDLLQKILNDKIFNLDKNKLEVIINIDNFIGFSKEQVINFIELEVKPLLARK
ncbi:MAG: adenylosuccinate lyase [Alphaproteobacteria bacterium]|nr:adenylosuccinate lyase [Alphaproteobacteria bacterium]